MEENEEEEEAVEAVKKNIFIKTTLDDVPDDERYHNYNFWLPFPLTFFLSFVSFLSFGCPHSFDFSF